MKRLHQKTRGYLRKVKKTQWGFLFISVFIVAIVWANPNKPFAGYWGFSDDEIAVVTIETNEEGQKNVTIKDPSKSFWDLLELLIVPLVLFLLGISFQKAQQEEADQIAKAKKEKDAEEAREEALQRYFDRVSELCVNPANGINSNTWDSIIKAHTSSIFRQLRKDSERKVEVVLFLAESGFLDTNYFLEGKALNDLNLSGASLHQCNLYKADLTGTDLTNANLSEANLAEADLTGAILTNADLSSANLKHATLTEANLNDADLNNADLSGADLLGATLSNAKYEFEGKSSLLFKATVKTKTISTDAVLIGATVNDARFGSNESLSEKAKQNLEDRGAIFAN